MKKGDNLLNESSGDDHTSTEVTRKKINVDVDLEPLYPGGNNGEEGSGR
jgi:hypothetical protein